jgi:hypothetical protein
VIAYDQLVLYLYVPRFVVAALLVGIACPLLRLLGGARAWVYALMAAVGLAPFWVAPWGGTLLKQFYLDCAAIAVASTKGEVSTRMAPYSTSLREWGTTQSPSILESDIESTDTPYIYTPSERHAADFCMVYLRGGVVDRVVMSPD